MKDSWGMKDLAKEVTTEFKQSARDIRESFGFETDPDLRLYKKLSEKDFAIASSVFGVDKVVDYIKSMEARNLRRRVG